MRTAAIEVRIGGNHQRANVHFGERCKSCIDLVLVRGGHEAKRNPQSLLRRMQ
jgi:hypothetical protein